MASEAKLKTLEGHEMGDYARNEIPKGRWSDAWGVFKSNFGKIVINNIITLVFFVPLIVILYIRNLYVDSLISIYPIATNVGASAFPVANMTGVTEGLDMSADIMFYSLALVAALIAAVGLAGSFYSMKKLLNTHGKFTIKSYFHGVKCCYLNVVIPVLLFAIVLFGVVMVRDWRAYTIALGGSSAWPTAAYVLLIILNVIVGILAMWFIAVGVSYKVKLWYLIKNSFVLCIGFILQTIIIAGIAFIPVWLLLFNSTIMKIIAYIILIVFGFSYVCLVWMAFTQWAFDMFITPNMEREKELARAKMTEKELAAEKAEEERRIAGEILAAGKSELVGRPILPIGEAQFKPVGKVFGRADIAAVNGEREQIITDISAYEAEHINDQRYVEYNKLFAEREKALKDTSKKGKKKKISSDNLLK